MCQMFCQNFSDLKCAPDAQTGVYISQLGVFWAVYGFEAQLEPDSV